MVNTTFYCLSLSRFISSSHLFYNNRILFHSCELSRLTKGFLFSSQIRSVSIINSRFHQILERSITIISFSNYYFIRNEWNSNSSVFLKQCIFQNCMSITTGGAFICFNPDTFMEIQDSAFVSCHAQTYQSSGTRNGVSGGAFLFNGQSSRINRCCFVGCYGPSYAVVYHSYAILDNHQNMSHFTNNGKVEYGYVGFLSDNGHSVTNGINGSYCKAKTFCSVGQPGTIAQSFIVEFCTIYRNSESTTALGFGSSTVTSPVFIYCNAISNSPSEGIYQVWGNDFSFKHFYFFNNTNSVCIVQSGSISLDTCYSDTDFTGSFSNLANCQSNIINITIIPHTNADACKAINNMHTMVQSIKKELPLVLLTMFML